MLYAGMKPSLNVHLKKSGDLCCSVSFHIMQAMNKTIDEVQVLRKARLRKLWDGYSQSTETRSLVLAERPENLLEVDGKLSWCSIT